MYLHCTISAVDGCISINTYICLLARNLETYVIPNSDAAPHRHFLRFAKLNHLCLAANSAHTALSLSIRLFRPDSLELAAR